MALHFEILRTGNNFSCKADGGPAFFVGRRVPYEDHIGLYNIFGGSPIERLNYQSADFAAGHGFWAEFIEPTAICEGRNFLTLNTYDRAAFTFGFAQFAAHVPDGDFVRYFRAMLGLPGAGDYFPSLAVREGRISNQDTTGHWTALESAVSTEGLMTYLNPTLAEVEDNEVIAAAKLIHWTSHQKAAQDAQVEQMISTFKDFIRRADTRLSINGRPAQECCVIADVLHHGRGGKLAWSLIDEALKSSKPFDNLIAIGAPKWDGRKAQLKAAIKARPDFLTRKWSKASSDFV